MANLAQLSSSNNPQKGTAALGILLQNSPFLRFLNATSGFELVPTDFDFRAVGGTSSAPARAEGGAYTTEDIVPAAKTTGALTMHGDGVDVDVTRLADAANGLMSMNTWLIKAAQQKLIAFAKAYESLLFNGDGTSNKIKGLAHILDGTALPGFSGVTRLWNAADYSVDSTPKSMDLTVSGTNYDKNLKRLIELLTLCLGEVTDAQGIIVNPSLHSRLTTIAGDRAMAANVTQVLDTFGRPVTMFNGIPLIQILPDTIVNTEDDDTATPVAETTSLYILSPGELKCSLVTNSGLQYWAYDALQAKESGREKWEIRAAWKIEDKYSVARIRNIKL